MLVDRYDILVHDRNKNPVLIVEVKKKFNASAQWAAQLRRNIAAHGLLPNTKFFLLAMPDQFYLWKAAAPNELNHHPDYSLDPRPFLTPYTEPAGVTLEEISTQSFELIITSWLIEVMNATKADMQANEAQRWLVDFGLYEAIAGGYLAQEVFA